MAVWPPVPPHPPGTPTARARAVLDAIHDLTGTPDNPAGHAEAITDLQAVTSAAYRAYARTIAAAQPGGHRGVLSITELQQVTGMSRNAVIGAIRSGRRYNTDTEEQA